MPATKDKDYTSPCSRTGIDHPSLIRTTFTQKHPHIRLATDQKAEELLLAEHIRDIEAHERIVVRVLNTVPVEG